MVVEMRMAAMLAALQAYWEKTAVDLDVAEALKNLSVESDILQDKSEMQGGDATLAVLLVLLQNVADKVMAVLQNKVQTHQSCSETNALRRQSIFP